MTIIVVENKIDDPGQKLFAFHFMIMPLRMSQINLFFFNLWLNDQHSYFSVI